MQHKRLDKRISACLLAGLMATGLTLGDMPHAHAQMGMAGMNDQDLARQLDEQAKQLIVAGKFAEALEKLEAAEIMMPDPERAKRIERVRAFVNIRQKNTLGQTTQSAPAATPPAQPQKKPVQPFLQADGGGTTASAQPSGFMQKPTAQFQKPSFLAKDARARVQRFTDYLIRQIELNIAAESDLHLKLDPYSIAQTKTGYRVELKPLAFVNGRGDGITAGPLVMDFQPKGASRLHVRMQFPNRMPVLEDGQQTLQLTIGEQAIEGDWNDALNMFERFDLRLANVDARAQDEPTHISLGEFTFVQKLDDQGQQWQQDADMNFSGLAFEEYTGNVKTGEFKVAGMRFTGYAQGHDLQKMVRLTQDIDAKTQQWMANPDAEPSEDDIKFVFDSVAEILSLVDQYGMSMSLDGWSIAEDGKELAALDNFRLDVKGQLAQNHNRLNIGLRYDGLSAGPQLPPQLQPKHFNFELQLEDFPSYMPLIETLFENPQAEEQLPGMMLNALIQSGTRVAIPDFSIQFMDFSIHLNAKSQVASDSPFFSIGEANLTIVNLPKLMELAKQMGQDEEVNQMLTTLALVSVRSQENGQTVDKYHLTWNRNGEVLLNGKEATALLGNAGQPASK